MTTPLLNTRIGIPVPLDALPRLTVHAFRGAVVAAVANGARISALFGVPKGSDLLLIAVLADDAGGMVRLASTTVEGHYPALTPECPQAHWFEREIAEQWGVVPEGHPRLKPIRYHASYRSGSDAWGRTGSAPILPCVTEFFRVEGNEVHEVAVGPVHAGIIEPGHFRFQCHGEHVFSLEIALGYQHRGIERALVGGPTARTIHYMETLAGDTSVGHALAYAHVCEALGGCAVPARAHSLRALALELERLANHTGDLGALANDVAYLPTASYCGRIRGDFLNMTALLCGNRLGRGLVCAGGVRFDADAARLGGLHDRLVQAERDVRSAVGLLWKAHSVVERFERTGVLTRATCEQLGLVGVAARACGMPRDVRTTHPAGAYCNEKLHVSTCAHGDVFARAYVRWLELCKSLDWIGAQMKALPEGAARVPASPLKPEQCVVSLVEGWRGEVCHVALTDTSGRFAHYKIVDPSFHNWQGLAMALRGEEISNFPLCNKSFNLSYCGHDL